jgi:hypothetical protein
VWKARGLGETQLRWSPNFAPPTALGLDTRLNDDDAGEPHSTHPRAPCRLCELDSHPDSAAIDMNVDAATGVGKRDQKDAERKEMTLRAGTTRMCPCSSRPPCPQPLKQQQPRESFPRPRPLPGSNARPTDHRGRQA